MKTLFAIFSEKAAEFCGSNFYRGVFGDEIEATCLVEKQDGWQENYLWPDARVIGEVEVVEVGEHLLGKFVRAGKEGSRVFEHERIDFTEERGFPRKRILTDRPIRTKDNEVIQKFFRDNPALAELVEKIKATKKI